MFDHRFIVTIPDGFPLEAAGPVFCAGITMYSPLVQWKVRRSQEQGGEGGEGSEVEMIQEVVVRC